MVYTTEQKISIIKWYATAESAKEVIKQFKDAYPDDQAPTLKTIYLIWHKFGKSGCLNRCIDCGPNNSQGHCRISNKTAELEAKVCAFAEISLEVGEPCSSAQIAKELNIPQRSVCNFLQRHQYTPYKIKNTHEVSSEDQIQRMDFCETLRDIIDEHDEFTNYILFTGQASFSLLGQAKPSVVRYWSRNNLHLSETLRNQYARKVNIWVGILGNHIVGPFYIDGALSAEKYLLLLQEKLIPTVKNLNANFEDIWFQQDETPVYNDKEVEDYLFKIFPGRVISTRGNIAWPPQSPDLAPCYFFLRDYITETLYKKRNKKATLDDLRCKITKICESITPETLENVRREFYDRLGYCEAEQGGLFEHLIK